MKIPVKRHPSVTEAPAIGHTAYLGVGGEETFCFIPERGASS